MSMSSKNKHKSGTRANAAMVTFQKDSKLEYSYKKMPKRKKRAWKKFTTRVKSVEASTRGTQQLVINHSFTTTISPFPDVTTGNRFQGISEVNLYSVGNDSASGGRDKDLILNEISNYKETKSALGVETPFFGTNELSRIGVMMNMARIDITYTNTGDVALEFDFYTIVHKNVPPTKYDVPTTTTGFASLEDAQDTYNLFRAQKLYYEIAGAASDAVGSNVSLKWRGITPFQTWGIIKYTGAKILNKTKVLVSPGQSLTRSYTDPRHRTIRAHSTNDQSRYDKDTTTYLAIAKFRDTGAGPTPAPSFTTGYTKTYQWTVEGEKNARQTYINSN